MRRAIYILLVFFLILSTSACEKADLTVFRASVIENNGTLIVEPQQGAKELKSSDKISVHSKDASIYDAKGNQIELSDIVAGQTVEITYDGLIAESYPAQITANKIQLVNE